AASRPTFASGRRSSASWATTPGDTATMLKELVHAAVVEAIDQVTTAQGVRRLSEEARRVSFEPGGRRLKALSATGLCPNHAATRSSWWPGATRHGVIARAGRDGKGANLSASEARCASGAVLMTRSCSPGLPEESLRRGPEEITWLDRSVSSS